MGNFFEDAWKKIRGVKEDNTSPPPQSQEEANKLAAESNQPSTGNPLNKPSYNQMPSGDYTTGNYGNAGANGMNPTPQEEALDRAYIQPYNQRLQGSVANLNEALAEKNRLNSLKLQTSQGTFVDPLLIDTESFLPSQNQQQFLDFLSNQAYGNYTPPSVAQRMLDQKTAEIAAQSSGAMASARGVHNPALLAVEAAKQGANIQQQAAQAGSVLQAQETAANQQNKMSQQAQFLAAMEADRQAKINLQQMRANVMTGNVTELNKANIEASRAAAQLAAQKEETKGRMWAAGGQLAGDLAKAGAQK